MIRDNSPDSNSLSHRLRGDALDRRVLDELRELQSAADPHFLARVMTLYLTESPKLMEQLNQSVTVADAAEIVRAAHSLKSSSASIGAVAMGVLCAEMVAAGRAGKVSNARDMYESVASEHARVLAALRIELTHSSQG